MSTAGFHITEDWVKTIRCSVFIIRKECWKVNSFYAIHAKT